jgi:putative SOS response-associated peptidase YedK
MTELRCTTPDAREVESFTIVTQPAGSPLNGYHDRAPVVVPPSRWAAFLDTSADVSALLGPESADAFNVESAQLSAP